MQLQCGSCGGERQWVLHNVCDGEEYRRLCTNCTLNAHKPHFCPFCFKVYDDCVPPSLHQRLMCMKCPSISHVSCLPSTYPYSSPPFICPSCSSTHFSFFHHSSPIDNHSARALLAATQIAASSMTKAAVLARIEAERRVQEAFLAKKRATEALERLAFLSANHKP